MRKYEWCIEIILYNGLVNIPRNSSENEKHREGTFICVLIKHSGAFLQPQCLVREISPWPKRTVARSHGKFATLKRARDQGNITTKNAINIILVCQSECTAGIRARIATVMRGKITDRK